MPNSTPTPLRVISHSLISSGVQRLPTFARALAALIGVSLFSHADALLGSAPQIFLESDLASLACNVEAQRPPALSDEDRARVIRSLPKHGEIKKLNASMRKKIESLRPLLGSAEHSAYEVKVIEVPQAYSGLYERTVLLLSASAVSLWTAEELQAIVAHELAHDYVWYQYQTALRKKQYDRLQQLELFCDGLAIIKLQRLGIDPSYLTTALKKSIGYNRDHFGQALDEDNYPTLDQRRQFHRALMRRIQNMSNLSGTTAGLHESDLLCPHTAFLGRP